MVTKTRKLRRVYKYVQKLTDELDPEPPAAFNRSEKKRKKVRYRLSIAGNVNLKSITTELGYETLG